MIHITAFYEQEMQWVGQFLWEIDFLTTKCAYGLTGLLNCITWSLLVSRSQCDTRVGSCKKMLELTMKAHYMLMCASTVDGNPTVLQKAKAPPIPTILCACVFFS